MLCNRIVDRVCGPKIGPSKRDQKRDRGVMRFLTARTAGERGVAATKLLFVADLISCHALAARAFFHAWWGRFDNVALRHLRATTRQPAFWAA